MLPGSFMMADAAPAAGSTWRGCRTPTWPGSSTARPRSSPRESTPSAPAPTTGGARPPVHPFPGGRGAVRGFLRDWGPNRSPHAHQSPCLPVSPQVAAGSEFSKAGNGCQPRLRVPSQHETGNEGVAGNLYVCTYIHTVHICTHTYTYINTFVTPYIHMHAYIYTPRRS